MRKCFCFLFFLLSVFFRANSQAIQYSKSTFRNPYFSQMQLVADVDGYHHLVCLSPNKNPLIYVFNAQLQFVDKKELALKLQGDCDVRILPFHGHYFLYFHTAGSLKHEMYMVRGNGTAINMSFALSKLINSVLKKEYSYITTRKSKRPPFFAGSYLLR